MKKIILDTSILIKYPKLLGLHIEDTTFIITIDVLSELNENENSKNERASLIDQAVLDGSVQIINSSLPKVRNYENNIPSGALSTTDLSLVSTALFFRDQGNEVQIASFDRDVKEVCRRLGVNLLLHDEIQLMLQLFPESNDNSTLLTKRIKAYENKEKRGFIWQVFFGIVSALGGSLIHAHFDTIFSTLHIWGMLLLFFIIGISLFLWREWRKLSYGVFEFAIGFAAIVIVLMPAGFDYKTIIINPEIDIKLLGGLYIMVRGQDNIVKGLKGTKVGVFFKEKMHLGIA